MSTPGQPEESASPAVSWPDMVKFVRQLGHDIRNHLNAVELQSAYLAELATDDEMKSEVQRLREMVSQVGTALQRLSAALSPPNPVPISYKAADFVEDLKQKIGNEMPDHAGKIAWNIEIKDAMLQIDPQLIQQALLELFTNAFQHERNAKSITANAKIDNGRFVFGLEEPKAQFAAPVEHWGREPLRHVSQGHYGLGLNRVRLIVEAHGGDFRAEYDRQSSTLRSIVTLPIERS